MTSRDPIRIDLPRAPRRKVIAWRGLALQWQSRAAAFRGGVSKENGRASSVRGQAVTVFVSAFVWPQPQGPSAPVHAYRERTWLSSNEASSTGAGSCCRAPGSAASGCSFRVGPASLFISCPRCTVDGARGLERALVAGGFVYGNRGDRRSSPESPTGDSRVSGNERNFFSVGDQHGLFCFVHTEPT